MSQNPPVITSVEPASVPAHTEAEINVYGSNLTPAILASFGVAGDGTVMEEVSSEHIKVLVPDSGPGHVDLSISNPFGSTLYEPGFDFTAVVVPPSHGGGD